MRMTITRIFDNIVAEDAAGVKLTESQDYDIVVELTGENWTEPDKSVGDNFGSFEYVTAIDADYGDEIDLTDEEHERALELVNNEALGFT